MLRSAARSSALAATALLVIGLATSQPATAKDVTWLGVYTQEITPELREGLNYSGSGVLVSRVIPGSPADKAGIERGDVIVRIGSRTVDSHDELSELVRSSPAGRTLDMQIVRDGRRDALSVTLDSRDDQDVGGPATLDDDDNDRTPAPSPRSFQRDDGEDDDGEKSDDDDFDVPAPPTPPAPPAPRTPSVHRRHVTPGDPDDGMIRDMMGGFGRGRLGVRVQTLNPDLASYFGRGTQGALVLDVTEGSPADRAGIRAGDVVTEVGSRSISSADDLIEAVRSTEGRASITLVRHGEKQTVEATLEPTQRTFEMRRGPRAFERRSDGNRENRLRVIDPRSRSLTQEENQELRKMIDDLKKEIEELRQELNER